MKPASAWLISVAIARSALAMIERQPTVEFGDHPVPIDEHVKRDDGRDDEKRQEAEYGGAARDERSHGVKEPLRALRDEIADRALNLRVRYRFAQPERAEPSAAVSIEQRVAFLDHERLQAHRIARQPLGEADELIGQHRRDDEQHDPETTTNTIKMTSDATRRESPTPLHVDDRIEQIAERDTGDERRHYRAEQV